jgi:hypothetical protein
MSDYDPFGRQKQSWFGPKRLGYGYGPRTWPGWLLVAVSVAGTIIVATATHSPLAPLVMVPVVVIAIISGARSR